MEVIFGSVKWQLVLVYLDNIAIFSKILEKHIEHVKQVLTPLELARIALNLRNAFLLTDTIDYLEYVLRPPSLEIAALTDDAIQKLKQPRIITELQTFQELLIVFRRFDLNFSRISAPLNRKLQNN